MYTTDFFEANQTSIANQQPSMTEFFELQQLFWKF